MTEDQQLELTKSLRGADGESLIDHAWRTLGLRELVAIPLYLTTLLKQAPGGNFPTTKEEVLRSLIAELEQDPDRSATLRGALQGCHQEFLEGIAVEATENGAIALTEKRARAAVNAVQEWLKAERQIVESLQPMTLLDTLVDAHILVRSGMADSGISFQNQ